MRQRKAKNLEERMNAFPEFRVEDGKAARGKWGSVFDNSNDIYMELGCGKGQFIISQAVKYPERNFIAVEGQDSVILRALEKAREAELKNIKFIACFINDVTEFFEEGELAGLYLNFSDPWPKERHGKRRLTHTNYLNGYKKIIKDSGCIEFKTDNDGLFEFSVEEVKTNGGVILEYTTDLHNSGFMAKDTATEYEERFKQSGKNINYMRFVF